jgi:hypothetical protein
MERRMSARASNDVAFNILMVALGVLLPIAVLTCLLAL